MNEFLECILIGEIIALIFLVMPKFLKMQLNIEIKLNPLYLFKNIKQSRYDFKHTQDTENYFKPLINWKLLRHMQELSTKYEDEGNVVDIFVSIKYRKKEYWEIYNYITGKYIPSDKNNSITKYKESGIFYCLCISNKKLEIALWGEKMKNPETTMFHAQENEVFDRLRKRYKLKMITDGDFHRKVIGEDSNIHGCYFREIKKWYE